MFARLLTLSGRAQWQSRLVLIRPMAPPNLFTQLEFFGTKPDTRSRDRSRSPAKKHWREPPRKEIEGLPRRAGGSRSEFQSSQSGRGAPRGRGGMQRGGRGSFGRGQPFASRGRGGVHRGGRGSFAGSREDGGRGEFRSPLRRTFDDDGSGSDGGGYTSQRSHSQERDRPSFRGAPRGRGGMNRGGRGSFTGGREDRERGDFRSPRRQTFDEDNDGSGSDGGGYTSQRSHSQDRDRPSFRGAPRGRGRGGMSRGGRGSFTGGRDDREFKSPRRQTFDDHDESGSDGSSQHSHSQERGRPSFRGAPRGRGGMNRGGRGSFTGGREDRERGDFRSPRRQTFDDDNDGSGSDGGGYTSQRSHSQERDRPSFRGAPRGRGGMSRGGRGSFTGGRDDRERGDFRSPRRQTFDEDQSDRQSKRRERRTKSTGESLDLDDDVPSPAVGKTGNKLKFIPSEVAEAITNSLQNVENQEPLRPFTLSPQVSDVPVSLNDNSDTSGGGRRKRQDKTSMRGQSPSPPARPSKS